MTEEGLTPQDPAYRRALYAALFAGLASFNAMYATQAVLPALADFFHASPATTALTISATTGALALAIVPLGALSERFGRRRILQISVLIATGLSFILALSPNIEALIALRFLQGVAVAGVPAILMTYLAEEINSNYLPKVMGLYIAGNTVGGLIGRLIPGIAIDFTTWRWSLVASAAFAFTMGLAMVWLLPQQKFFRPKPLRLGHEVQAMLRHWSNPMMLRLFLLPFLIMGAFVSLYNYLSFRLIGEFGMLPSIAALVFVLYLSGTWSSARSGAVSERFGRGPTVLWSMVAMLAGALVLLVPNVVTTLLGALLFTAAMFMGHSTASTWVAASAQRDRAEASSSYILMYYLGSSVVGWISGAFFERGWWVLIAWIAALVAVACVIAAQLSLSPRRHKPSG